MPALSRTHNNPPDPIDAALAPFGDFIAEAENWLDGKPVENESQMREVDAITKSIKSARAAVKSAEESEAAPLYDEWKAAKERYKPTLDDLDRLVKGLVASVDAFKRQLAAEKEAARRAAERLAFEETRKAQEVARQSPVNDIAAQRAAAEAISAAENAQRLAMQARDDTVKGMRSVTRYIVADHKALLNWIAKNDRDALTAFIDEWARKNHKTCIGADGLNVWKEKEAY